MRNNEKLRAHLQEARDMRRKRKEQQVTTTDLDVFLTTIEDIAILSAAIDRGEAMLGSTE